MWAKVEGASVTEIIPRPKPMTIGDIQYPRKIFSMWEVADLKGIGIHPVTLNTTNRKDSQYYVNTDITYTWDSENETVTGGYDTLGYGTKFKASQGVYTAGDYWFVDMAAGIPETQNAIRTSTVRRY